MLMAAIVLMQEIFPWKFVEEYQDMQIKCLLSL
jgi:hypothetical protein